MKSAISHQPSAISRQVKSTFALTEELKADG
jgi:hypothetical protein